MNQYLKTGLLLMACSVANADENIGRANAGQLLIALDDLAYPATAPISYEITDRIIRLSGNELQNCQQETTNDPPQPSTSTNQFSLETGSQSIGIDGAVNYDLKRKAIILTSLTDNLICDNSTLFDRIFIDDFD